MTELFDFFGVGGARMRAAGCDTIVDTKDLAVVGITEVVRHLPRIYGCYRRLIAEADKRRSDLAIVIDSPSFNWRVARQMRRRGIPVVYYVCPQFWAWRQGRVRLLRKYIDKALVIFPFEEKFYRDRGVDATFIGHPLASLPRPAVSRADYAAEHGLDPAKFWITLMPGSRVTEVQKNLPVILASAAWLGSAYEYLLPVAPTLDRSFLQRALLSRTGFINVLQGRKNKTSGAEAPFLGPAYGTTEVVPFHKTAYETGSGSIHLVPGALPALAHSRAGIIASGTATVEAALMGTPFVMVYRVAPLTYWLGRPRVKVPHFAMVNLIAGKEVVPELVQQDFSVENVVAKLNQILPDGPAREEMIRGLAAVRASLGGASSDGLQPAERAAKLILQLLAGPRATPQQS
jgi:lipid-A-disaccharide synthase